MENIVNDDLKLSLSGNESNSETESDNESDDESISESEEYFVES